MSQDSNTPPNPPSNQNLVPAGQYRGQDLSGLTAFSLSLSECDFTQSELSQANFSQSDLKDAQFDAARLRASQFVGAILHRVSARLADFENANCSNADFLQANLTSAVFFNANLQNASLRNAHLQHADLRDANLFNADLSHTVLDGADLAGANIEGAQLNHIKAKGARIHGLQCTPEQRTILLAAGAYEGLPPLFARIQSNSESLIRRISTLFKADTTESDGTGTEEDTVDTVDTVDTKTDLLSQWQQQFKEWQERQKNLKLRREEEEESWRAKQEADRLKHLQRRLDKENKRRDEKEKEDRLNRQKKAIKKQTKARKQQMARLNRELRRIRNQSRSSPIFNRLQSNQFDPTTDAKAIALKKASDDAYQAAESAYEHETDLQGSILDHPDALRHQEMLEAAETQTRQKAQMAIAAETAYFDYLEAQKAMFAEAAIEASEQEKERQRQAERMAQEQAVAAAVLREEAEQRARLKIQNFIFQSEKKQSALNNAEHIAKRSREQIRAAKAAERAERLRQETELKRYQTEQSRFDTQVRDKIPDADSPVPNSLLKDLDSLLNEQAAQLKTLSDANATVSKEGILSPSISDLFEKANENLEQPEARRNKSDAENQDFIDPSDTEPHVPTLFARSIEASAASLSSSVDQGLSSQIGESNQSESNKKSQDRLKALLNEYAQTSEIDMDKHSSSSPEELQISQEERPPDSNQSLPENNESQNENEVPFNLTEDINELESRSQSKEDNPPIGTDDTNSDTATLLKWADYNTAFLLSSKEWALISAADSHLKTQIDQLSQSNHLEDLKEILSQNDRSAPELDLYRLFQIPKETDSPFQPQDAPEETLDDSIGLQEQSNFDISASDVATISETLDVINPNTLLPETPLDIFDKIEQSFEDEQIEAPDFTNLAHLLLESNQLQQRLIDELNETQAQFEQKKIEAEREKAQEADARKAVELAQKALDTQRKLLNKEAESQSEYLKRQRSLIEQQAKLEALSEAEEQKKLDKLEAAQKALDDANLAKERQEKRVVEAQKNAYDRLRSLQNAEINRNRALKEAETAAQKHREAQLRLQSETELRRQKEDKARAKAALEAQQQAKQRVSLTLNKLALEQQKRTSAEAKALQAAEAVKSALEAERAAKQALEAERIESETKEARLKQVEERRLAEAKLALQRQEAEQQAALKRLSDALFAEAEAQEDAEAQQKARREAEARTRALEAQQQLDRETAIAKQKQETEALAKQKLEAKAEAEARKSKAESLAELRQKSLLQQQRAAQAAELVARQTKIEMAAKAAAERAELERKEVEARLELLTKRLYDRQTARDQRLENRTEAYYLEQSEANRSALLQRLESNSIESSELNPVATLPSMESPFQKKWYKSTDFLARYSPNLANRLDTLKEDLETRFAQRKSAAYRERERQEYENRIAKAEREKVEHNARINRLRGLQASAEREAEQALIAAQKEALQKADEAQREAFLAMSHSERHRLYRSSTKPNDPVVLIQMRFVAKQDSALQLPFANAVGLECLDSQLKASNFMSAKLRSSTFINTRLSGSNFDRAVLEKSRLDGSKLEHCSFISSILRLTRSRDCQLSHSDFSAANLEHTEWLTCQMNKADFSQVKAFGANFMGCQLRGARFQYADLRNAQFDQAELNDVDFSSANVEGADFRGAVGLNAAQSADLKARGALVDITSPLSLDVPQLRAALVLFGLAGAAFMFSYFTGQPDQNLEEIEAAAQILVDQDPIAAAAQYERLADESRRISDKVAYFLEASALYDQVGEIDKAKSIFDLAAVTADADQQLQAKIGLRHARFLLDHDSPLTALERLRPFYVQSGFGAAERASLIILVEESCQASGVDSRSELEPIFELLAELPDSQADLYMALAESRMDRGDYSSALADIESINDLTISPELKLRVLETKARIEDRSGDLAAAISTLNGIITSSETESLVWQAAQLAKTDILLREGDTTPALENLKMLQSQDGDSRILARSKLIEGRIYETLNQPLLAIEAYKELSLMDDAEPESQDEARVSLSRVIAQTELIENTDWADDLPRSVIVQARLGQLRVLLDDQQFEAALKGYEALLSDADIPAELKQAAQSGKAEANAGLGDYAEADRIWRQLLTETKDSSERAYLLLQQAHGMLQSGRTAEAYGAFESLSQAQDPEIMHQGLMGLAETARANGERERAKSYYTQLIGETDNSDYKVDAYLELALIATEQNDVESSIQAFQSVLTLAPEQSTADSVRAQLAEFIIESNPTQAQEYCTSVLTVQSLIQCAELMSPLNRTLAGTFIQQAYDSMEQNDPLYSELCLIAARLLPDSASEWIIRGLTANPSDSIIELGLLQLGSNMIDIDPILRSEYLERFNLLSQENPKHAAQSLLALSVEQRISGQLEISIQTMEQALELELQTELKEQIMLELADTALEGSLYQASIGYYEQLTDSNSSNVSNAAYLGIATAHNRLQQSQQAVEALALIEKPSNTISEHRFVLLSELINKDSIQAIELLESLELETSNTVLQLRIEAQSMKQNEDWDEAAVAFKKAIEQSNDPVEMAWIEFELIDMQLEQEQYNELEARLSELRGHSNTEILVQAHIRTAQWLIQTDQPSEALEILGAVDAQQLGPGWDTSLEELRAVAHRELGDYERAIAVYLALADRWPNNEEAEIPAWLGIASIHQQTGTVSQAREWAQRVADNAEDPIYQAQAEAILSAL